MNLIIKKNLVICISMAIWVLASCKIIQPYKQPVNITNDKLYRDISTTDTSSIASISWKDMFSDKILQSLIQEGIDNNPDLQVAIARIRSASANFKQSKLSFLPSLNAGAAASFQDVASTQFGFPEAYQLSMNASWMADLWGQLSSAKRAALASMLQSEAYRRAVQTQLISDIATNYYLLMSYDAALAITEKTLSLRKEEVETMKILKEGDIVTGAAVVQSTANRYSVEITIPDLKQNIRETENAISVLLGKSPDTIMRASLEEQPVDTNLSTGVPAQLLANRPDVQQAEFQLRNSFEMINVARTYFYPSLNITASAGFSSLYIAQMFNPSLFFSNLTGSLLQPVFNQGINKQRLAVAQARYEEYLANFRKSVLTAGQEVSNALYSYKTAVEKESLRLQQIAYLEKSVEFTKELLKYSSKANYTDVLTSEQSLLSAQLNSVNDKLQQLTAVVSLYKSLGGGWK
ncbi:MAG: efflux transporter outer membrane subunit [Bacteroidetes bacterium]|nr:efflux transporter outer membrane subunit [Bacteroidota bacterium]